MLKRDISSQFMSNLALLLIGMGVSVVVSRMLGPEGRGILAMAMLLPSIVATFGALGQESVNSTFAGLYKDHRAGLFHQSLLFTLFGAGVSVLVVYGFFWLPIPHGNFDLLSDDVILASCFVAPILIFNTLILSLLRGVGRVVTSAGLSVLAGATMLALLFVFLVILKQGVLAAVWISAVSPLPVCLLAVWLLRCDIGSGGNRVSWWFLVKSLRFGLPICLAMLASFLVFRLDQGLLAYMVKERDQGLYAVAVQVAERVKLVPSSIAVAFLPRLANELDTRQQQVPAVFRATMVASFGTVLAIGIVGAPAIVLLYGMEFAGAVVPFLILLPGVGFLGGSNILASDLLTRQRPVYSVVVSYAALVVSVLLNLVLIPLLGIAGAALAATGSYATGLGLWAVIYVRTSGTRSRQLLPGAADVRYVWNNGTQMLRRVAGGLWPSRPAATDSLP